MHGAPCSSATTKKDDGLEPKVGFIHRSSMPDAKSLEEYSHIVGPVIARDTQILDQYLPQVNGQSNHVPIQPSLGRRHSQKPIYHVPVPPRRPSPADCACSRNSPAELFDQVSPFLEKLLAHFYDNIHPCFPVTEQEYIDLSLKERQNPPQTMVTNIIAHSLFYWDSAPALAAHVRPDQDFAWSTAVAANTADMQRSDISTIISLCINVAGRPSRCMVSNLATVARTVALSHSIGLNHDCSEWKISDLEKAVRWKAWWGVVIQDRWYNFAQGTPPYISKGHYDVPIPTLALLTKPNATSPKHLRAAEVYIHLCRLTEIVGDVLPLIYHVRSGNDGIAAEQTSRSEIELNRWVESRPSWLSLTDFHNRPQVPGLANLQLSYLSVRMLLRRIAWHEISQRESEPSSAWLAGCQAAAEDIVRFITSLHPKDLSGFWLPFNAHHFTSAVTLLLRCALQTSYASVRGQCMASARTLVDCLRTFHDQDRWDLSETVLAYTEAVLKRIEDSLPQDPISSTPSVPTVQTMDRHPYINVMPSDQVPGDTFFGHQANASIEELFPEIFSDFTDTALFAGPGQLDINA